MLDRLRDWWEGLAPRERRLLGVLGLTAIACVVGFVFFTVSRGLAEIERANEATRRALVTLAERRDELDAARHGQARTAVGDDAPALGSYLEGIEGEVGVQIRASTEKPAVTVGKGKFHEKAVQVSLYDVTLAQLAAFLEKVETKSPVVVTQRLFVKRSSADKEKMDRVEITVATYERARGHKGEARAERGDAGGAKGPEKPKPAEPGEEP